MRVKILEEEQKIYANLCNYCRWDEKDQPIWIEKTKELLEDNSGLDLIYKDGILFGLAISNESIQMLEVLISYYEQNNLQSDPDTIDYKIAKYKLAEIIQHEANAYDFSNEMQSLLAPYLPSEDDESDRERDFEEIILDQNHKYDSSLYKQYVEAEEERAALEAGFDNRKDFYKSLQYAALTRDNLHKFTQEQEEKYKMLNNGNVHLSSQEESDSSELIGQDSY